MVDHSLTSENLVVFPSSNTVATLVVHAKKIAKRFNTQDPLNRLLRMSSPEHQTLLDSFKYDETEFETLRIKIKSRFLCYDQADQVYQCTRCRAVLTDSIDFIDSKPLVELYEPIERKDLGSAYYDLLVVFPKLNDKKEL